MEDSTKTEVALLEACPSCAAKVRTGSDYCFNCGNKLVPVNEAAPIPVPSVKVSSASQNGSINSGPGIRSGMDDTRRQARRRRSMPTEPVQVVWNREEGLGMGFILLSAGAAVFTVLLIAIAYYLK